MKILFALLTACIVLSSCPERGGRIYDSFQGRDRIAPKVTDYALVSSDSFRLVYDESVALTEILLDGEPFGRVTEGTVFMITFPQPLERGESAVLSVTATDLAGNTVEFGKIPARYLADNVVKRRLEESRSHLRDGVLQIKQPVSQPEFGRHKSQRITCRL